MSSNQSQNPEILFEFTKIGQQMRVAAIHVATNTEVIAITPANATRQQMQQLALGKLKRRMAQDAAKR